MNRLALLGLVGVATLSLTGCPDKAPAAPADPPSVDAQVPEQPAPEQVKRPGLQWQLLETPDFSLVVPGKPKTQDGTEQTEAGPVKTVTWSIQTPSAFFAVSTADYPTGKMSTATPSKVLEGARDGAIANVQGVIEKDMPVVLESENKKKYEGREFVGSTKSGIKIAARLFLVEDRLYQLICVGPKRTFNEEDFRKFVDGFIVKSPVAVAAPKKKK